MTLGDWLIEFANGGCIPSRAVRLIDTRRGGQYKKSRRSRAVIRMEQAGRTRFGQRCFF